MSKRAEIDCQNVSHALKALRHGLSGQIVIMPGEDLASYREFVQSFVDEYQPDGATEIFVVQALADTAWRLNRAVALETNLLSLGVASGADPLTQAPAPIREAMAIAAGLESRTQALVDLSAYGRRLHRQFENTLALLRDLQVRRQIRQAVDLEAAASEREEIVTEEAGA